MVKTARNTSNQKFVTFDKQNELRVRLPNGESVYMHCDKDYLRIVIRHGNTKQKTQLELSSNNVDLSDGETKVTALFGALTQTIKPVDFIDLHA